MDSGTRTATGDDDALQQEILAAALDPAHWAQVLSRLAASVPGGRVHLLNLDPRTRDLFFGWVLNYDDSFMDLYQRDYHVLNPLPDTVSPGRPGEVRPTLQGMDTEALFSGTFYNEWLRPQEDLHRGGGVVLEARPGQKLYIGADIGARDVAQGAEAAWLALLSRMAPLLQHAIKVNVRLGLPLSGLGAAVTGLTTDATAGAIFVLRPNGQVVAMTDAGQSLVAAGEVVGLDALGRLYLPVRGVVPLRAESLGLAQRPAATGRIRLADGTIWRLDAQRIAGIDGGTRPIRLLSAALPGDVALVLTSEQVPFTPLAALLEMGLTEAEAEVALLLAQGARRDEIAQMRGVLPVTVANQIKSACHKTGARGQLGLAVLVRRLAETRRHDPDGS